MVCRNEYTSTHVEVSPGLNFHVCEACIVAAEDNFIWICLNCGKVYIRPKTLMMAKVNDPTLKNAYASCSHRPIILGIDICIECDPQGILKYVKCMKPDPVAC